MKLFFIVWTKLVAIAKAVTNEFQIEFSSKLFERWPIANCIFQRFNLKSVSVSLIASVFSEEKNGRENYNETQKKLINTLFFPCTVCNWAGSYKKCTAIIASGCFARSRSSSSNSIGIEASVGRNCFRIKIYGDFLSQVKERAMRDCQAIAMRRDREWERRIVSEKLRCVQKSSSHFGILIYKHSFAS